MFVDTRVKTDIYDQQAHYPKLKCPRQGFLITRHRCYGFKALKRGFIRGEGDTWPEESGLGFVESLADSMSLRQLSIIWRLWDVNFRRKIIQRDTAGSPDDRTLFKMQKNRSWNDKKCPNVRIEFTIFWFQLKRQWLAFKAIKTMLERSRSKKANMYHYCPIWLLVTPTTNSPNREMNKSIAENPNSNELQCTLIW